MSVELLVNVTPSETRVALVENGLLQEVHVERQAKRGIVGNIYKGKISRVLPGMQAAFVDIGMDEVAFLRLRGAATMAVRLREQREHALLWRQLTTIALDAPLGDIATGHERGQADGDMLSALSDALRFGPMTRRRLRVAAGLEDPAY